MPRDGYSRISLHICFCWNDLICSAQRQMKNNDALFEDSASPIGSFPPSLPLTRLSLDCAEFRTQPESRA
jgi:hypothetical protein